MQVKAPSPLDRRKLVPFVWWQGARTVDSVQVDEQGCKQHVKMLQDAMEQIEEAQLRLCTILLHTHADGEKCVEPRDAFSDFLKHLLRKVSPAAVSGPFWSQPRPACGIFI